MPLLRRKRFSLEPAPSNLRADEEVFYVEATGEIFRDYKYVCETIKQLSLCIGVHKMGN